MGLVQPANAILYDFYNPGKDKEIDVTYQRDTLKSKLQSIEKYF